MRMDCNAKINLGLFITEKRQDGFHNLESIFLPIPWFDVIQIEQSDKTTFTSSGILIDGDHSNNLCMQAYQLLAKDFILPPVSIHLEKNIPIGAGLGGGSSNAAFVLKGLNEMFQLNLSVERLEHLASELGSDCTFFIQNRAAFVTGRGEKLNSDLPLELNCYCLVVNPGVHISTKEAFSNVSPKPAKTDLLNIANVPKKEWQELIYNDFETSILPKYKQLQQLRQNLQELNPFYVSMSGSGSTFFALFEEKPTGYDFLSYANKCFKLNVNQKKRRSS